MNETNKPPTTRSARMLRILILINIILFSCYGLVAQTLNDARRMMDENRPQDAAKLLRELVKNNPADPWLLYNLGVAEYGSKNYEEADRIWEELAASTLPKKLQTRVWTQIGNVSFRKGEPLENSAPEQALPHYEQSREAYKIALAPNPNDKLAQYNLKVVEQRLAKIHATLAKKLLQQTKNTSLKETIEKTEAALDHQRTAVNLVPENKEYANDVKQTENNLSNLLTKRAEQAEQRADNAVKNPNSPRWEREQAIKNLENALTDFREAANLNKENQQAKTGEERVLEKLSNLLTKNANELKKEADREASWNPDEAISKYENAIDNYDQALQLNQNNQTAQTGREETREALEKLLMKQGDKLAQEGRNKKENNPAEAAEKMMQALNNYEHAIEVNPSNTEAPPKIEAIEKELPPLLIALGKREQQRAAQEEQKTPEKAVAHLEKAATSFDLAQQIEQNNHEAEQLAEQTRKDLLRLREKLAQMAQQKNQQQQKNNQYTHDFQTMLGWVKNDDKQREYEESRRSPTTKYTPQNDKIYKNW
ncbi:MAG: hypothetical protein N2487_04810 [Verrucomicrobiae bacterium]|nr:hypothetical protein [Verrucomicrobiae bacterium]